MQSDGKNRGRLSMRSTLVMFALIPMVTLSLILSLAIVMLSRKRLDEASKNSLYSVVNEIGIAFDYVMELGETTLQDYATAPIVKEALLHPNDAAVTAKLQKYTEDYYSKLEGWDGVYLADWNTMVMAHPNKSTLGMILRKTDAEKDTLRKPILSAGTGVYNVGILTSPASGKLVVSMYCAVKDDNGNPIGFVGGGFYIDNVTENFSDVSSLGYDSAYVYYVDKQGIMLGHPDPAKIGNPVENDAVKGLVEKLSKGEHPAPDCITYKYKGVDKYAAYYVGAAERYIAVLTADRSEVLAALNGLAVTSAVLLVVGIAVFSVMAVGLAVIITRPYIKITAALDELSKGEVNAKCDIKSIINETVSMINSTEILKDSLNTSMTKVKNSADDLNAAIISVDEKAENNVKQVSQINTAIGEVAETSQVVAEDAQKIASEAVDLGEHVDRLNGNVIILHDASQTIKSANDEASACMRSVYENGNESVAAMQQISDKIAETNNAIDKIGSAVQAIESIAAQTNLLSLNASIEAARAGEAGRGFAVVADEIRALADSSANSAKEIKQIIEDVIALSKGTVEISDKVFEVINREQADIETAQNKFNVLSESVESSINEIEVIRKMTSELNSIKEELSKTTSDLGALSEELGASAEEVAASCQIVTNACNETQKATLDMSNTNKGMTEAIGFFKL